VGVLDTIVIGSLVLSRVVDPNTEQLYLFENKTPPDLQKRVLKSCDQMHANARNKTDPGKLCRQFADIFVTQINKTFMASRSGIHHTDM
jgi:hypothetical protein